MTLLLSLLPLLACSSQPELPDYGPAPDFSLTDEDGQPVTSALLEGQVFVADFIFTRCGHSCPMITRSLATVAQGTAEADVDYLSFTVDPEHDTPEVLKAFAGGYDIPLDRWHLLTGEMETIEAVSAGYMQGLVRAEGEGAPDIKHSQRLILVDAEGRIRGMHRTDPEELEALTAAALVLAEPAS